MDLKELDHEPTRQAIIRYLQKGWHLQSSGLGLFQEFLRKWQLPAEDKYALFSFGTVVRVRKQDEKEIGAWTYDPAFDKEFSVTEFPDVKEQNRARLQKTIQEWPAQKWAILSGYKQLVESGCPHFGRPDSIHRSIELLPKRLYGVAWGCAGPRNIMTLAVEDHHCFANEAILRRYLDYLRPRLLAILSREDIFCTKVM